MSAPAPPGEAALPPGQRLVQRPPIVHLGEAPVFDPTSWSLRVEGGVEHPLRLAWRDLADLARTELRADFHAATGWSCRGLHWSGIALSTLVEAAAPEASVRHLVARDGEGYSAAVELEHALAHGALLATEFEGEPLTRERGGPLRLVVPGRYGWKSVKWVRVLELQVHDEPGYWESRGAHPVGDPQREQRTA